MKKDLIKTIVLLIICLTGALLVGFNAGKLSNVVNIVLFVLGVVLLSMSTLIIGLLKTLFKCRNKQK